PHCATARRRPAPALPRPRAGALPCRHAGAAGHAGHLPGHGGHLARHGRRAGRRGRPARDPLVAGRSGARPGLRFRHLGGGRGILGRAGSAGRIDAARAPARRTATGRHQREQTLQLLQKQADAMPLVVDRLQEMMATLERQNLALHERLAASQDAFHGKADAAYTRLAAAMEQALKQSVADNAEAAGAAIRPAVEATLAGLARETSAWQDTLAHAVRQQLDDVTGRFEATTGKVAELWTDALAQHRHAGASLAQDLGVTLQRFNDTFEQRSAGLLDNVGVRLDTTAAALQAAWDGALARQ